MDFEKQVMLLEYEKAQDSAEHHDHMAWFTSTVLVVASITLFGLLLTAINKHNSFFILYGCIIGFLLIIINWKLFSGAQNIKIEKYKTCKKIEKYLNELLRKEKEIEYQGYKGYQLQNHLLTEKFPKYARYLYFLVLLAIALGFVILFVFLISVS